MTIQIFTEPKFRVYGDQGLLMEFGDVISPEIHRIVRTLSLALEQQTVPGVIEIIPSYRSVAVCYDPLRTSFSDLESYLTELYQKLDNITVPGPEIVSIPVCYGGEYGPDLEFVASHNGVSVEDVIRLHSEPEYLIYMLGFTPGFPFLGGLNPKLHTPRLQSPRKNVAAGSVGIANDQTGVYPIDSPGGWQLIGRVPVPLFNPNQNDPFLLKCGDILQFTPISTSEYRALRE